MKKATKIIGAVLGVLLVAALFTGAAAAVEDQTLGDAYAWKLYGASVPPFPAGFDFTKAKTWTMGDQTITFVQEPGKETYYFSGKDLVEGTYSCVVNTADGDVNYKINVKAAPAAPTGVVKKDTIAVADLANAEIDTTESAGFSIEVNESSIAWTNPDETLTTTQATELGFGDSGEVSGAHDLGTYTIQQIVTEAGTDYSALAPYPLLGKPTYFTLYKADDAKSLKASVDEVLQSGLVTVELTAPYNMDPGYKIGVDNGTIPKGQATITNDGIVKVDLSGVAYFTVKSNSTDNIKVKLYKDDNTTVDKTLTIKVKAGAITADAASAATFIGNEVKLSGSNELGGTLYFYIKGPNFPFTALPTKDNQITVTGKEWEAKINTAELKTAAGKKPDAGNYTIYVAKALTTVEQEAKDVETPIDPKNMSAANLEDANYCDAYTTVVVALKQPFINITEAPAVVVMDSDLVVKGTAEGQPPLVKYYIFGTNFFLSADATVDEDGVFEISKKIENTDAKPMQAGQYFLVIQHPMYDQKFNVGPVGYNKNGKIPSLPENIIGYYIVKNENGNFGDKVSSPGSAPWPVDKLIGKIIFDTNVRQSANAAQALCDSLDDQNIDDMYVKASFIVAGKTSVINPIPEQITKGQDLVITGVAVGHKNEVVTAELLSTAFAAVPKETVGSASFVSMTARIDENGLWTVTIDTSDLNADDYTVSVSVGQLDPATQKIKIVEGTVPQPTAQPTGEPTVAPTTAPTQTPASPGFGILAALAGLGAVAVLLLRRQ